MTGPVMRMAFILLHLQRSLCVMGDGKEVSGKRPILETLRSIPSDSKIRKTDLECNYRSTTVNIALDLVEDVNIGQDVDLGTFYELLQLTESSMCGDGVKAKLYTGLVTYGLLGKHSSDISRNIEIKQAMDAIEPRWWYAMLAQAAREFRIGMAIDDTTVRLSSGPASCDLTGIDLAGIKA